MSDFFKETGKLGVGLILSGIAGLALNIGLGNILSGQEYGIFRIFFSAVLLTGWIFAFGIEREITTKISNKNAKDSEELGKSIYGILTFGLVFVALAILLRAQVQSVLKGKYLFQYFIGGTIFFMLYRYMIGVLKGRRQMEKIGILQIIIGFLKLMIVVLAFYLGWTAFGVNVSIMIMFFIMSIIPLYWASDLFRSIKMNFPSFRYFRDIISSTLKQVGEVGVRFAGPLIVTMLGGTSTDSGIFGAMLTLSLIPYYGYRAIIQNMLPEVSELKSEGDQKGINRRVSFLTETTLLLILLWAATGYIVGPYILQLVYKPSFIISSINGLLIFFLGSLTLLAALFTEILIGLNSQEEVAKSWIIPGFIAPIALLNSGSGISLTAQLLSLYLLLVTVLLGINLFRNGVNFKFTGFNYKVFE